MAGIPDTPPEPPPENPYKAPATSVSMTAHEIDFDFGKKRYEPETPNFHDLVNKAGKPKEKKPMPRAAMIGIQAACILAIVIAALFAARGPVSMAAAPLAVALKGLGMPVLVPGEGASIDRLVLRSVWKPEGATLELSTRLINLKSEPIRLAPIRIEATDEKGEPTGPTWVFDPPAAILAREETVPMTVTLDKAPPPDKSGRLMFRATFVR